MKFHNIIQAALCCMTVLLAGTSLSANSGDYSLTSPDGHITVNVAVGNDIKYSISRDGKVLIAPSAISMNLSDGIAFGENDRLRKVNRSSYDETCPATAYKKAEVWDNYNQIRLQFNEFSLVFRVYDDGAAYRFESNLDKKKEYKVISEQAEFDFGTDRKAFVPYVIGLGGKQFDGQFYNSFENTYTVQNLSEWRKDKLAFLPLAVEADNGVKVLVTDANLTNYPGMYLLGDEGSTKLKGIFATYPKVVEQGGKHLLHGIVTERENFIAKVSGDEVFPWRAFIISTDDAQLAVNDLVWKLSPPQEPGMDFSWVKPGKVAWDWWNGWNIYGVDFKAGINTETYKYYIDFAAAHNIEYVILDHGWAVKKKADLLQVIPEIDMPGLVKYGQEKGIGIILWAGYWAFDRDMENICRHYAEMGVKGFKVDYMDRDDQIIVDFHSRAAEMTARYGLLIDFHGTYKPTGLNRRWPNVVNYEGVHGLEQMKWSSPSVDQVTYDVTAPFIRMAAGPMDYTQGAMRNATRANYRPVNDEAMSQGTRCRQLAEYVIFDAPLNMLCDSPSNYMREEECTKFISSIPTVWDESIGINGEIGKYITLARRSGKTWYVGSLTDWNGRDLTLDLSFLGEGNWTLDIFQDGVNADRAAQDYSHTTAAVPDNRQITVHLAPSGGWVAKILPASESAGADTAFKFRPKDKKIYHKGWIDLNKNGVKDIYEDQAADIDARVEDLLSKMTIEEKTCQMVTLYGYGRVLADPLPTPEWKEKLWKDGMGAIDEHLNGFRQWGRAIELYSPYLWPASTHAAAMNEVQRFFIEDTRLGIPVDFTNEGIRGVEAYRATNFPTQLGLGHTWDSELIHEVGRITGREGRLLGYTNVYAPILDVGRDQRWGRYEEVYGESPYLVGELGVQMTLGMQTDFQVASTAKHFAAYSNNKGAREGMSRVDPQMAPHEVENIHIHPWKEVISRAGLLGAMVSYNDYDGEPIEGSHYWLTERLRDEFGFKGYLVSDSDAVEYLYTKHNVAADMKEAVRQSVMAGLNVRCTFRSPDSYVLPLRELVEEGTVPMSVIDERVRDILRVKFIVGLFDSPYQTDYEAADEEVDGAKNNGVALRASLESLVLLKNASSDTPFGTDGKTLPLNAKALKRIAVIGPNADDTGYAHLHYGPLGTKAVSVLDGLRTELDGKADVVYAKGCELVDRNWPESEVLPEDPTAEEIVGIAEAVKAAESADVTVLVLGGGPRTCGENKSRTSLELPGHQNLLLKEIIKTGKPVVVVLINGRPLSINYANKYADAIMEAWYPGAHGGTAVAKALLGEYNPGGKLTVTFPRTVGQIPFNFPYKPASQVDGRKELGQGGWASRVNGSLYDFGYGLSYTTFKYTNLRLSAPQITPTDSVLVSFNVTNTGKVRGDEVVQLYVHDCLSSITVYEKVLRGFERISLEPGETRTVEFKLTPKDLAMLDRDMNYVVEPGDFEIMAAASSTDIRLQAKLHVQDNAGSKVAVSQADDMKFSGPARLGKGDFLTIPAKGNVNGVRFMLSSGSDAEIHVQITNGGGQFLTVSGTKHCISGQNEISFPATDASELRIVIEKGKAVVENIEIY